MEPENFENTEMIVVDQDSMFVAMDVLVARGEVVVFTGHDCELEEHQAGSHQTLLLFLNNVLGEQVVVAVPLYSELYKKIMDQHIHYMAKRLFDA